MTTAARMASFAVAKTMTRAIVSRYQRLDTWQKRRSQIAEKGLASRRCLPIEKLKRYRQIDAREAAITQGRLSRYRARLSPAPTNMCESSSTLQQVARFSR